jgi:LmbE family N-acetylglucosaminyl deacetylase
MDPPFTESRSAMPVEPGAAGGRRHYALIVVSPHLDDAVFSCSVAIAAARALGPVLVINVFSRFTGEVRHHGVILGDLRLEEERAAARELGFESLCLDELDASCRRPEYQAIGNIFRPMVAADRAWQPALQQRLHDVLAGFTWDRLPVPLAVGWHVDHMLVHQAFDSWREHAELTYYEDVPYAWIDQATRLRLDELGRHPGDDGDPGLARRSLWSASRCLVGDYCRTALMRNLRPLALRLVAYPVVGWYLHRLIARHRRPATCVTGRLCWTPRSLPIPDAGVKVQSMRLYGSQFRAFFLGDGDCRTRMAAARTAGVALERQWICRTGSTGNS